jgi:hypothetical protein
VGGHGEHQHRGSFPRPNATAQGGERGLSINPEPRPESHTQPRLPCWPKVAPRALYPTRCTANEMPYFLTFSHILSNLRNLQVNRTELRWEAGDPECDLPDGKLPTVPSPRPAPPVPEAGPCVTRRAATFYNLARALPVLSLRSATRFLPPGGAPPSTVQSTGEGTRCVRLVLGKGRGVSV